MIRRYQGRDINLHGYEREANAEIKRRRVAGRFGIPHRHYDASQWLEHEVAEKRPTDSRVVQPHEIFFQNKLLLWQMQRRRDDTSHFQTLLEVLRNGLPGKGD